VAQGVELSVRIPWKGKDRRAFVDQAIADGITRIIAGGGDGTLNKVSNILMKKGRAKKVSMGIMPLGTANDFAFGAGIPREDLNKALLLAATGTATAIDIGKVNGLHFINVASGGFGAEITATTPQDLKAALGGAAYTLMGLAKALKLKPYNASVVGTDGQSKEVSMIAMAVGNNRFAGGGFEVAPKADMRDGLLDLSILSNEVRLDPVAMAAEIADPFNKDNKVFHYRQERSFSIQSDRPLHMNLDGEPLIDTRFEFETIKRKLSVVLGNQTGN
ncbi:MAG: lipid kinase YegS, partial [Rhizobiaceae bacterium]